MGYYDETLKTRRCNYCNAGDISRNLHDPKEHALACVTGGGRHYYYSN
jgi:hypothetical protein